MNRYRIPMRRAAWGFALSAVLLAGAETVPASAQDAGSATGTLPGGVTYELRPDRAAGAAAVALWFRAPAGGFGAPAVPGLSRLAAAAIAGSAPITGTPLGRLVERCGGRLTVSAYPESVGVTALVPPDRVSKILRAMTADFFAPVMTQAGLRLAQRDVTEEALIRSYDPADALEDALGGALFESGPFHDGTLATADAIAKVGLPPLRRFAERAFRPANAILILTGEVDASALGAVATREGSLAGAESPAPEAARRASDATYTREGNAEGTGLGWTGPPISDEAAATALDFVADALFSPKTGAVAKALGDRKVTVTGKFVTYRKPGLFLVTISGDDAAAARPIVERAIAAAATPMQASAFVAARARFVYRLLGDMQTPAALAETFGWYAVEGAAAYAPAEAGGRGRYFAAVSALTPEAVAQAVSRYLAGPPAVAVLVRAKAATAVIEPK